jgi:hypothetical protein
MNNSVAFTLPDKSECSAKYLTSIYNTIVNIMLHASFRKLAQRIALTL